MRQTCLLALLAVVLSTACARKADVDAIAPGTDVTVKQADGVTVTGKLVEVTPASIIVDERAGVRRALARRDVTSVAMVEIPLTPQPNQAASDAAPRAQPGADPVVPTLASNVPADRAKPAAKGTSGGAAPAREPTVTTVREVTVPAGTVLPVRLDSAVGSDISRVEETVRGTLTRAVSVGGAAAIPAGSQVIGSVTSAVRPGKVKGRSYVAVRFHTLMVNDDQYAIRTGVVARRGRATKKKDAAKIGIPAAGGAVIGGIVGGKKGAAIGGAAGGGAGTAVVLSTRGEEVRLPRGTVVSVRLAEAVRVRVPAQQR